jgi:hypothetical protein
VDLKSLAVPKTPPFFAGDQSILSLADLLNHGFKGFAVAGITVAESAIRRAKSIS